MRRTRNIAASTLVALALLAGCGGDDDAASTTTSAGGVTTTASVASTSTSGAGTGTTRSPDALKAALLQPGDVPGSATSPSASDDQDLSACFPGNPLAAATHPSEVSSDDLDVQQGGVRRNYSSSARIGTVDQATEFVTTFGSAAGSTCILNQFKAALAAPPNPIDGSGLAATPGSAAVTDAGSIITITGNLVTPGEPPSPLAVELIVFRKGTVVVFLSAGASGGALVPGQGLELARKISGRLP